MWQDSKIKVWENSKTENVTKLKMWLNSKTQNVRKQKNKNVTKQKTQILTKLISLNCDTTNKLEL